MFPLDFGIMENNNYNNYLDIYSAFHIPKATFIKYIWQTYAYDNYMFCTFPHINTTFRIFEAYMQSSEVKN